MNMNRLKIFINRAIWMGGYEVRIGSRINESVPWAIAQPLTFVQREPKDEGTEVEPCMRLSQDDAQTMMDELWGAGIRPSEGSGSAGSLAATQRHLDDMRALVFKTPPKSPQ